MKKIVMTLLAMLMIFSMAGCSSGGSSDVEEIDFAEHFKSSLDEGGYCTEEAWEEYSYLRNLFDESFKFFYEGSTLMYVRDVREAVEDVQYALSNCDTTTDLGFSYEADLSYVLTLAKYTAEDLPIDKKLMYVSNEFSEIFDEVNRLNEAYPELALKDFYVGVTNDTYIPSTPSMAAVNTHPDEPEKVIALEVPAGPWYFKGRPTLLIDDDPKILAEQVIAYTEAVRQIFQINANYYMRMNLSSRDQDACDVILEYLQNFYQAPEWYSGVNDDIDSVYSTTFTWMYWELETYYRLYEYQFEGGSYDAFTAAQQEAVAYDFLAIRDCYVDSVCEMYGIVKPEDGNLDLTINYVNQYIYQ